MMKMEIKLDEVRIRKDGEYDVADLWQMIDKEFASACTKEVQPDGSVMYTGIEDRDYFTDFASAHMILSDKEWMAKYCVKWIWYDNDDDEGQPYDEEDVLVGERSDNPLFKRWA